MVVRKSNLHAVKDGDAPKRSSKPSTVAQAAAGGDHRELLVAMRDRIATAVADPSCPPRDLASLTRRLQDIAKEIASLDAVAEEEARNGLAEQAVDESWNEEAL